jgi:hypothetical protein
MAAGKALGAKTGALAGTMFLYRLSGIFGATGKEAATAPKEWTDRILVTADHCQQQLFHRFMVSVESS